MKAFLFLMLKLAIKAFLIFIKYNHLHNILML